MEAYTRRLAFAGLVSALAVALAATAALASTRPSHPHGRRPTAARHRATGGADGGALYAAAAEMRAPNATSPAGHTGGAAAPSGATGATGPTGPSGPGAVAGGPTGGTAPPGGATAATGPAGSSGPTGSTAPTAPTVPGALARILPDGLAAAPDGAPAAVRAVIAAGNQLIGRPYVWGGGHASFIAAGYDCSGAVSYTLHGGALVSSPLDSTAFESWGLAGPGRWITVYTNPQHAYMEIAGIRLDTSSLGDPNGLTGPRWRPLLSSHTSFLARHPAGF